MSVWQWVIRRVGWLMVITVLPKALEPAAVLFHCHRRPAVCLFVCLFSSFQMFTGPSCFLTSVSENTGEKTVKSQAARTHLSVRSQAHVQTETKKKKKSSLKSKKKKWRKGGDDWWGRNKFLLWVSRIFHLLVVCRDEKHRWVQIGKSTTLSDKKASKRCQGSEEVA